MLGTYSWSLVSVCYLFTKETGYPFIFRVWVFLGYVTSVPFEKCLENSLMLCHVRVLQVVYDYWSMIPCASTPLVIDWTWMDGLINDEQLPTDVKLGVEIIIIKLFLVQFVQIHVRDMWKKKQIEHSWIRIQFGWSGGWFRNRKWSKLPRVDTRAISVSGINGDHNINLFLLPSLEWSHIPTQGMFEDDLPFPGWDKLVPSRFNNHLVEKNLR